MKLTLFDLDGTLLATDSDHAFGEFLIQLGWADAASHRQRNDAFYADYQAGRLDMAAYVDFATSPWRDRGAEELAAAQALFIERVVQPALHPAAVQLVQSHREQGDLLAIVTATNEFVTRPIAALFGISELIATELVRDPNGRVTGAIAGTPSPSAKGKSPVCRPGWRRRADRSATSRPAPSTAIPPTTCRCSST